MGLGSKEQMMPRGFAEDGRGRSGVHSGSSREPALGESRCLQMLKGSKLSVSLTLMCSVVQSSCTSHNTPSSALQFVLLFTILFPSLSSLLLPPSACLSHSPFRFPPPSIPTLLPPPLLTSSLPYFVTFFPLTPPSLPPYPSSPCCPSPNPPHPPGLLALLLSPPPLPCPLCAPVPRPLCCYRVAALAVCGSAN